MKILLLLVNIAVIYYLLVIILLFNEKYRSSGIPFNTLTADRFSPKLLKNAKRIRAKVRLPLTKL